MAINPRTSALRFAQCDLFKPLAACAIASDRGLKPSEAGDFAFADRRPLERFVDGFAAAL